VVVASVLVITDAAAANNRANLLQYDGDLIVIIYLLPLMAAS
jgi:hypothetical protein